MQITKSPTRERYLAEQRDSNGIRYVGFGNSRSDALKEVLDALCCPLCRQECAGVAHEHLVAWRASQREIKGRGGLTTLKKHGREHFARIGRWKR